MEQWQPAPPEPRPSFAMKLGIASMVVIVLGALTVIVINLVGSPAAAPTALPSASSANEVPTLRPEPAPAAWELPERSWEALPVPDPASRLAEAQTAVVHALAPVRLSSCPHPTTVTTEKQWQSDVRAQWACVHRAFLPLYEEKEWPTAEPEVRFFSGMGSDSDCGYVDAPAFYCAMGEGTVHFGGDHFAMAQGWDLSINEMVNHEYGHHLQRLAGITAAKAAHGGREVERRSELQAVCWSAMLTIHNRSFTFNERDLASWEDRLDSMREDREHGSRASLTYWGVRGLYAESMGECNTWVVSSDKVA